MQPINKAHLPQVELIAGSRKRHYQGSVEPSAKKIRIDTPKRPASRLDPLPLPLKNIIASFLFQPDDWLKERVFFQTNRSFRTLEQSFIKQQKEARKSAMVSQLLKRDNVQGRLEKIPSTILQQLDFTTISVKQTKLDLRGISFARNNLSRLNPHWLLQKLHSMLDFFGCAKRPLKRLLEKFPQVRKLDLTNSEIVNRDLAALKCTPQLETLQFGTTMDFAGSMGMQKLDLLQEITEAQQGAFFLLNYLAVRGFNVNGRANVDASGIQQALSPDVGANFKHLYIDATNTNYNALNPISLQKELKILFLATPLSFHGFFQASLDCLASLPLLHTLYLLYGYVNNAQLESIVKLTQLKNLGITCHPESNLGLLTQLKNLESLVLWHFQFRDQDFLHLQSLPTIKSLQLFNLGPTRALSANGLSTLSTMKNLETLAIAIEGAPPLYPSS